MPASGRPVTPTPSAPAPRSSPPVAARPPPAPPLRPPRPRNRALPWIIAAVVAVAGVTSLFVIPISESSSKSFSIHTPGGSFTPVNQSESFDHNGMFDFNWNTADGHSVTFAVYDSSGAQVYHFYSSSASAQISVESGESYTFSVSYNLPETVSVSGSLNWKAPAL